MRIIGIISPIDNSAGMNILLWIFKNPDAKAFQLAVTIGDPIILEESDAVTLITVVQSMNIVLPHLIQEHALALSAGEDHTGSNDAVDASVKTANSKAKSKQSK
jgi:hypothetical protein